MRLICTHNTLRFKLESPLYFRVGPRACVKISSIAAAGRKREKEKEKKEKFPELHVRVHLYSTFHAWDACMLERNPLKL